MVDFADPPDAKPVKVLWCGTRNYCRIVICAHPLFTHTYFYQLTDGLSLLRNEIEFPHAADWSDELTVEAILSVIDSQYLDMNMQAKQEILARGYQLQ
jgi:hypothetical protein